MEKEYDLITNNPFSFLKITYEGELSKVMIKISNKVSQLLKKEYDEHMKSGKKVNPHLGYLISDKYKLINRVMNRVMYGLGVDTSNDNTSS
jgi:hypothetical protein